MFDFYTISLCTRKVIYCFETFFYLSITKEKINSNITSSKVQFLTCTLNPSTLLLLCDAVSGKPSDGVPKEIFRLSFFDEHPLSLLYPAASPVVAAHGKYTLAIVRSMRVTLRVPKRSPQWQVRMQHRCHVLLRVLDLFHARFPMESASNATIRNVCVNI